MDSREEYWVKYITISIAIISLLTAMTAYVSSELSNQGQDDLNEATARAENGGANCHVDLKDPSATGFKVRVEEDRELDGTHVNEIIGWIAIE